MTSRVLGALRVHLGEQLELIEREWAWVWITDFPMFEYDEEEQRWGAVHHPFTRPTPDWEERFDADPGQALALAYDLIGNGNELGGGSFRIHEPELQAFGIDRMLMVLAGEPNLRDTIAFPKNQAGADPMTGAPTDADPRQLKELGIQVVSDPKSSAGP
jgi:aspartyl-tRNA synthetase